MRAFGAPLSRHAWCQRWCADVRNHLASRKLNWRTPTEKMTGDTPDISVFRFHFWEPVWYYDPHVKAPEDSMRKGRFLGIARSAGDTMTYYVETERPKTEGKCEVLVRSVIRTRRKNIGTDNECIDDDVEMVDSELDFQRQPLLPRDTLPVTGLTSTHGEHGAQVEGSTITDQPVESSQETSTDEDLYIAMDEEDPDFDMDHIEDYRWDDGMLHRVLPPVAPVQKLRVRG